MNWTYNLQSHWVNIAFYFRLQKNARHLYFTGLLDKIAKQYFILKIKKGHIAHFSCQFVWLLIIVLAKYFFSFLVLQ